MIGMNEPILSPWFVIPLAAATLLFLAGHLKAMQIAEMPESRRRIRTVNGLLMMFVTPLVAYLFGIVTADDERMFLLSGTAVVSLLFMIILLALLDALNTVRIARREQRELRRRLAEARAHLAHPSPGNA